MNRTEFMRILTELLADISEEERIEAIQYYNDYFDDAGVFDEARVIAELGTPERVAAMIRSGLQKEETYGEYTEKGFTDSRFEEKTPPAYQETRNENEARNETSKPVHTSKLLKLILLVILVIAALPLAGVTFGGVVAVVASIFGIVVAIFAAGFALAIVGVVLFFIGIAQLFINAPVGFLLIGVGLVVGTIGIILFVCTIRWGIRIIPSIIRGLIGICRKPFERKGGYV